MPPLSGSPVMTNMEFSASLLGWEVWSQNSVTLNETNKDYFLPTRNCGKPHEVLDGLGEPLRKYAQASRRKWKSRRETEGAAFKSPSDSNYSFRE